MNRHAIKARMARRMAKRRRRILAQDRIARHFRSMPYLSAYMLALRAMKDARNTTTSDHAEAASKRIRMAQIAIEATEIGMEALKVRCTPTEILSRL